MYATKAKTALKDDLEHMCVENIQACILVGNTCFGDCNADAESLYFGTQLLSDTVSEPTHISAHATT